MIPFGALIAAFDTDALRPRLQEILRAAYECGVVSEEKLAVVLDIDRAQLHRQVNGDGHFSLTRLAMAFRDCPDFWSEYGWELIRTFGLPKRIRTAANVERALDSLDGEKKRMAKVEAMDVSERRTA